LQTAEELLHGAEHFCGETEPVENYRLIADKEEEGAQLAPASFSGESPAHVAKGVAVVVCVVCGASHTSFGHQGIHPEAPDKPAVPTEAQSMELVDYLRDCGIVAPSDGDGSMAVNHVRLKLLAGTPHEGFAVWLKEVLAARAGEESAAVQIDMDQHSLLELAIEYLEIEFESTESSKRKQRRTGLEDPAPEKLSHLCQACSQQEASRRAAGPRGRRGPPVSVLLAMPPSRGRLTPTPTALSSAL